MKKEEGGKEMLRTSECNKYLPSFTFVLAAMYERTY